MELNELIYLQNPWWRDHRFLPKEHLLPRREVFPYLLGEVISLPQITSITGIRRTGKSTLMKQVIAELFQKEIKRNHVLYFSFDQPTVEENLDTIEEIISLYFQKILNQDLHKTTNKTFFFFDEIPLVPFWQDVLKRYYDLNNKIKFVVSGSSSLFISQKAKESLAGRIFEKKLAPLAFSEYKRIFDNQDFLYFLDFGQFPEFSLITDDEKKIEYLKEGVIGKVLNIDIVKSYHIRKPLDFERLFWSLLPNTGQIIKSSKLTTDLQLKKATLFKYLSILENSLLIGKVLNLSGSFRSEKRLLRKLYPASTNFLKLIPEPISLGFKVETYIATLLKGKWQEIYLYRQRGQEIDFVIPSKKIAIEVKYQNKIHPSDYFFLKKFIGKKGYQGIIIAKNAMELPKENIKIVTIEEFENTLKTW